MFLLLFLSVQQVIKVTRTHTKVIETGNKMAVKYQDGKISEKFALQYLVTTHLKKTRVSDNLFGLYNIHQRFSDCNFPNTTHIKTIDVIPP